MRNVSEIGGSYGQHVDHKYTISSINWTLPHTASIGRCCRVNNNSPMYR